MSTPASQFRAWAHSTEMPELASSEANAAYLSMWNKLLLPMNFGRRFELHNRTVPFELYRCSARTIHAPPGADYARIVAMVADPHQRLIPMDTEEGSSLAFVEQKRAGVATVAGAALSSISDAHMQQLWMQEFRQCNMMQIVWYFRRVRRDSRVALQSFDEFRKQPELLPFLYNSSHFSHSGGLKSMCLTLNHETSKAARADERFCVQADEAVYGASESDTDADFGGRRGTAAARKSIGRDCHVQMTFQFCRLHALRAAVHYLNHAADLVMRVSPHVLQLSRRNPFSESAYSGGSGDNLGAVCTEQSLDRVLFKPLRETSVSSAAQRVFDIASVRQLIVGAAPQTSGTVPMLQWLPNNSPDHANAQNKWFVWQLTQHHWRLLQGCVRYAHLSSDGLTRRCVDLQYNARQVWADLITKVVTTVGRATDERQGERSASNTAESPEGRFQVEFYTRDQCVEEMEYHELPDPSPCRQQALRVRKWQPFRGVDAKFNAVSDPFVTFLSDAAHLGTLPEGNTQKTWIQTWDMAFHLCCRKRWNILLIVVKYSQPASQLQPEQLHALLTKECPALFDARRPEELFSLVTSSPQMDLNTGQTWERMLYRFLPDRFWLRMQDEAFAINYALMRARLLQRTPELNNVDMSDA